MYPSRAGSNCFTVIVVAGHREAGKVSFRRIGGTSIVLSRGGKFRLEGLVELS